jgi:hypothetical protein
VPRPIASDRTGDRSSQLAWPAAPRAPAPGP